MNNNFEDDELLAKLSKSARRSKAPRLDEGIIHSAISSKPKVGRRRFFAPTLMFNLAGGAAVIAGVFVFTGPLGATNQELLSSGTADQLSKRSEGALSLAMGNVKITEEDLLARDGKSLAEYGQSAVGNYVSNNPGEYVDEIWTGTGGTSEGNLWVFVVTDDVHIANGDNRVRLSSPFTQDKVISHADQLASSSDADGIRLLIQGDSNVLYPIVVPVNEEQGSLYTELRDYILSDTFTKVPTF
jgi:hypothetical protein